MSEGDQDKLIWLVIGAYVSFLIVSWWHAQSESIDARYDTIWRRINNINDRLDEIESANLTVEPVREESQA